MTVTLYYMYVKLETSLIRIVSLSQKMQVRVQIHKCYHKKLNQLTIALISIQVAISNYHVENDHDIVDPQ